MLTHAALFLLDAVIDILTFLLLLRFAMQALRVSFANPIGEVAVKLTNWLVKPLRRVIPGLFGLDLASLLPAYALQILLVAASSALTGYLGLLTPERALVTLPWLGLLGLLRAAIHLLIGALLLQAILSWVNPYAPIAYPLNQLTAPLLNPIRRLLPEISGLDLSPLVALLLAQVVLMFL